MIANPGSPWQHSGAETVVLPHSVLLVPVQGLSQSLPAPPTVGRQRLGPADPLAAQLDRR